MHEMTIAIAIPGATPAEINIAKAAALAVFRAAGLTVEQAAAGSFYRDSEDYTKGDDISSLPEDMALAAAVWDNACWAAACAFRRHRGLPEQSDHQQKIEFWLAGPYDDLTKELEKLNLENHNDGLFKAACLANVRSCLHNGWSHPQIADDLAGIANDEAAAGRHDIADLLLRAEAILIKIIAHNEMFEIPTY